jgi:hypothetical protein
VTANVVLDAPEQVEHVYVPRGAAARLLECRDDEVLLSGPAGTGKSLAALTKLHLAMMKYPGARGLIVRKTAVSLSSTTLATWNEHVVPKTLATGEVDYYGGSRVKPPAYRYRNGSSINLGGMDKPSKIMSSEYDLVVGDEATEFTVSDHEAFISRLRHGRMPYSQVIAACNPDAEHHFLKQRANGGLMTLLESRHRDNPRYYTADGRLTAEGKAYIVGKLGRLTGVRRLRLLDGLWAAAEGLVYEDYDPEVHLVNPFDIPDEWVRWWTVDFGYTNPFVLQCWAEDGDGRLYLYRELYMSQRPVEDHARKILSIVAPTGQWNEPKPRAVICDHDAEGRATLERHLGMSTVAATKTVSDGLQATQTRLRPAGDARPRLYVMRGARVERDEALAELGKPTCTAEEFSSYVWAKGPDGKPAKEQPEKRDDHGMDGMRYMVAQRDLSGRPGIRILGRRR